MYRQSTSIMLVSWLGNALASETARWGQLPLTRRSVVGAYLDINSELMYFDGEEINSRMRTSVMLSSHQQRPLATYPVATRALLPNKLWGVAVNLEILQSDAQLLTYLTYSFILIRLLAKS